MVAIKKGLWGKTLESFSIAYSQSSQYVFLGDYSPRAFSASSIRSLYWEKLAPITGSVTM